MVHFTSSSLVQFQMTLGMSQREFGEMLGVTRRTVARWNHGGTLLLPPKFETLVRALHAKDPALAKRTAASGGQTLESLGIVRPAPAPPPPPVPTSLFVESIVCAAAEALGSTPAGVRDVLRAAFGRARRMRLSVEEVDDALRTEPSREKPARARA